MSKKSIFAAALLGATVLAGAAQAQNADFAVEKAGMILAHFRVIDVSPLDSSSSTTVGGKVSGSTQATAEVDASYFVTNNISLELIAATTQHSITAKNTAVGNVRLGTTGVLPPTLTVKYHFLPNERFSPYVGAGVNYTFFYNSRPSGALGLVKRVSYENNFGEALQIGFDYAISGPWTLNVDVKQIFLSTKASIDSGAIRGKTNLDPLVVGLGVGYKF